MIINSGRQQWNSTRIQHFLCPLWRQRMGGFACVKNSEKRQGVLWYDY